jgi:uncharacterized protein YegJ (DUF2314 family)
MRKLYRPQESLISVLALTITALPLRAVDPSGQSTKKNLQQPECFQVSKNRPAMHRAVTEARRTVGKFIAALQHPVAGQEDFAVKKPCLQNGEEEHLWLSDVRFIGNRFEGKVDNRPQRIKGLKQGQVVSVDPNEITDWMYVQNGQLVGGYTLRAHYAELAPEQRQEFDREADFKISGR